jgi:hypothetical protein
MPCGSLKPDIVRSILPAAKSTTPTSESCWLLLLRCLCRNLQCSHCFRRQQPAR